VSAPVGRPLSVALMLESDGPGGAERMLLELAESLRERGHAVCPVGPDDGCGWLAEQFRMHAFVPETFSVRRTIDVAGLLGMVRTLRRRGVDVVHSHEFTMAVYGAAAARLLGKPHVITMHGSQHYAGRWRRRAALRWAFHHSRGVVAVSRATESNLVITLGLKPGAVTVIPNGVRHLPGSRAVVRRELAVAEDALLVVAVGNLYAVKGHNVLLRALAELCTGDATPPWRLAIAGRGEEEERLRALATERGISSRVALLGYRTDIPDILAAADIYVMPSLSEGLPLALLEAMFAAKPIVVSEVGGIPEVVTHEREALLVPPGDHMALAAALRRLMQRLDWRAALGRRARERARSEYSVERMTDAYERVYQRRE